MRDTTQRPTPRAGGATVSLRISTLLWTDTARRRELLALLEKRRDTISEVAFFTSFTHPPLPYSRVAELARQLHTIMPPFKALGLRVGINHLSTIGHLDENLENSLSEPWQKITDVNGTAAKGSYCPLDTRFQAYVRDCYKVLAEAGPDFIWIDDDVRMAHHPPAQVSCFCDLCLGRFAEETGEPWTRARAAQVLLGEATPESRELRAKWVAHNRRLITELFDLIRAAVDEVNPGLPLGFMCCPLVYEGMAFDRWGEALAGPRGVPVKWRPGGGFYTDAQPLEMLRKAHQVGRVAEAIPGADTDIQYEHENFPYQKLKKSETIFVAEAGAALAAGCTGVALNLMGISPDPVDEYLPYVERVRAARPLFDRLVALAGRSPCEGLWPSLTPDIWAAGTGRTQADPLPCLTELAEIGLPPAYSRAGACVHLLSGHAVDAFPRAELEAMLAEAVLLDGPALQRLQAAGLAELVGFEVVGTRDRDTIERFTGDELNGRHAGWWRDCRPSFWRTDAFLLRPLSESARPLAELIDFNRASHGPVMGVFENRLGGRAAVLGYYPWTSLQNLAKSTQMKRLCQWLSRDRLPAYVSSFHKVALWCRRAASGQLAMPLLNASCDTGCNVRLHVRADGPFQMVRADAGDEAIQASGRDGAYQVLELPALRPWEMVLVVSAAAAKASAQTR